MVTTYNVTKHTNNSWTTAAASKHYTKKLIDISSFIRAMDSEVSTVEFQKYLIDIQIHNKEQIGVYIVLVSQVHGDTLSEGGNDTDGSLELAILAAGDDDGGDTRWTKKVQKVLSYQPSDHEDTQPWKVRINVDLTKVLNQAVRNEIRDKSDARDLYLVAIFINSGGILNPSDCEVYTTEMYEVSYKDRKRTQLL